MEKAGEGYSQSLLFGKGVFGYAVQDIYPLVG